MDVEPLEPRELRLRHCRIVNQGRLAQLLEPGLERGGKHLVHDLLALAEVLDGFDVDVENVQE